MKDLFQLLKKYGLTPNGHYLLYCLEHGCALDLPIAHSTETHKLKLQGLLDEESRLTPVAKTILVEISKDYFSKQKSPKIDSTSDFKENLLKYRDLFPSSKDTGRPVRNSLTELEQRMLWFIKTYPDYDWGTILNATSRYISSMAGEYRYCMTSAYFIKKNDKSGNWVSTLASWCESMDDEPPSENPFEGFNQLA